MRILQSEGARRPLPVLFPLDEVPHLTLEPTRACNLNCQLCYALDRAPEKSLATLREELDMARRRRRLHAVTLVGGEPTLYDGLPDLVSEIRGRGLRCQLLTNGVRFLEEEGPQFLRDLIQAGLNKVAFHVDGGQGHEDVDGIRRRLFGLSEAEGLLFSLSLTVYPEAENEIPQLVQRYASYRYFDGILAVLGRDPENLASDRPLLETQHHHMASDLGLQPSAYVPSSRDAQEAFWLLYGYFIRADTGETFGLSPILSRVVRKAGRLLTGRYRLVYFFDPRRTRVRFLILGILDVMLAPHRASAFLRMIRGRGAFDSLRGHFIAVQRPPEADPDTGELAICFHCPDATIRNGRITPVCLADFVRPFDGQGPREDIHERWRQAVDEHLGEE